MNCRELLCISILIFCTTTNAAPSTTSKWLQLAKESKFLPYKSTLLSTDVMPFLSACYDPKCCSPNDEYSCRLYFDVVSWSQEMLTLPNVTKELIETISPQPVTEFCAALNSTYTLISSKFGHKIPFDEKSNTQIACIIGCGDLTASTANIRPPCRVSLWLLNMLSTAAKQVKEMQTKEVAKSAPKSEDVAAESKSADPMPPAMEEASSQNTEAKPLPDHVIKDTTTAKSVKKDESNIPSSPTKSQELTKPQEPTSNDEKDTKKANPPSVDVKTTTVQKLATKEATASGLYPGSDDIPPKPMLEVKTTTETSSFGIDANLDKKEKQIQDPGMEDYEEDIDSKENKPNSVDQMEDLNEQDDSLPKVESNDIGQMQKAEPDLVLVDGFKDDPGSNFFFYFLFGMFAVIVAYVVYNNKSKIVALVLEGRRAQGGRGRRKHTAAYRKLDSNLEEAIMSAPSGRTTQVIY